MASLCSLPVLDHWPPWRKRLLGGGFVQPPWHDCHPDRLALDADLPAELLRLARTIDSLVDRLDLAALVGSFSGRGSPANRPDLMLKAVLFFTQRGIHSPAAWFLHSRDSRAVAWLLRGLRPSRDCFYCFRQRLSPFIDDLNRQLLRLAHDFGLLVEAVPVLDGTLIAANSSRRKTVNLATLTDRLEQLLGTIAGDEGADDERANDTPGAAEPTPAKAVPAKVAPVVQSPAAAPLNDPVAPLPVPLKPAGSSSAGDEPPGWMAKTSQGKKRQRQRYLKAEKELRRLLEENSRRRKEDRKQHKDVRISLGDPEATLGLDKERVYRPVYNVQAAVDLNTDFYLGYGVFSGKHDGATLEPMLRRVGGLVPWALILWVLVDAGYTSGRNLRRMEQQGVLLIGPVGENDYTKSKKKGESSKQTPKSAFRWDQGRGVYVCPEGHDLVKVRVETKTRQGQQERHTRYQCKGGHCPGCPRQQGCTKNPQAGRMVMRNEYEEEINRQRERMQQPQAQQWYKKRKEQAERGFADAKEHRHLRRLSARGQAAAQMQVGLVCLTHNMVVFDQLLQNRRSPNLADGPAQ